MGARWLAAWGYAEIRASDGRTRHDCTLHGLLHTHASRLITAGMDVLMISRRIGHASPEIMLRVTVTCSRTPTPGLPILRMQPLARFPINGRGRPRWQSGGNFDRGLREVPNPPD